MREPSGTRPCLACAVLSRPACSTRGSNNPFCKSGNFISPSGTTNAASVDAIPLLGRVQEKLKMVRVQVALVISVLAMAVVACGHDRPANDPNNAGSGESRGSANTGNDAHESTDGSTSGAQGTGSESTMPGSGSPDGSSSGSGSGSGSGH